MFTESSVVKLGKLDREQEIKSISCTIEGEGKVFFHAIMKSSKVVHTLSCNKFRLTPTTQNHIIIRGIADLVFLPNMLGDEISHLSLNL